MQIFSIKNMNPVVSYPIHDRCSPTIVSPRFLGTRNDRETEPVNKSQKNTQIHLSPKSGSSNRMIRVGLPAIAVAVVGYLGWKTLEKSLVSKDAVEASNKGVWGLVNTAKEHPFAFAGISLVGLGLVVVAGRKF